MHPTQINIQVERDELLLPRKAYPTDAGFDLFTKEDFVILPYQEIAVGTGVTIHLPPNFVGLVYSRSGMALNQQVIVLNAPGVIDSGYSGEVKVILKNLSVHSHTYPKNSKIAQLIIHELPPVSLVVSDDTQLTKGARGVNGFGSTD